MLGRKLWDKNYGNPIFPLNQKQKPIFKSKELKNDHLIVSRIAILLVIPLKTIISKKKVKQN